MTTHYFERNLALAIIGVTAAILMTVAAGMGQEVQYKVLYSFCAAAKCADGLTPLGKLAFDDSGNLYGTTTNGGAYHSGTLFKLSFSKGTWSERVLYSFCLNNIMNCPDGANPSGGLINDAAGNLYGTTAGGGTFGLGTVFRLSPPGDQGGDWTETALWSFGGEGDGIQPSPDLFMNVSGAFYGTTAGGGTFHGGTVFRLVPHQGDQWTEDILFSFGPDQFNGYSPRAGVTPDQAGNVYGTTIFGGTRANQGWGVVYKLTPTQQFPWTQTVLFRFSKKIGIYPLSTVNIDALGNLYGTLSAGENFPGGTFRLTPAGKEHTIPCFGQPQCGTPRAGVLIHGNALYGTSELGGAQGFGALVKIQKSANTVLYSFCSQANCADGSDPMADLVLHSKSLFGTTRAGGANGGGVVFQISEPAPVRSKSAAK